MARENYAKKISSEFTSLMFVCIIQTPLNWKEMSRYIARDDGVNYFINKHPKCSSDSHPSAHVSVILCIIGSEYETFGNLFLFNTRKTNQSF